MSQEKNEICLKLDTNCSAHEFNYTIDNLGIDTKQIIEQFFSAVCNDKEINENQYWLNILATKEYYWECFKKSKNLGDEVEFKGIDESQLNSFIQYIEEFNEIHVEYSNFTIYGVECIGTKDFKDDLIKIIKLSHK